ncbi:MAG: HEAT repeat domain-containing protein [Sandaracinaceae bacterium]|nr:HEAT repeat domain-containing protein [Sandaracinaceae bacterium]
MAALLAAAGPVRADARTDYLVRVLGTSPMFRVRAQAAVSLGVVTPEPAVIQALSRALSDEHPSVRAAAAASLERQHDASALPALRNAANDRDPTVQAAVRQAITTLERFARTQPRTSPVPPAAAGGSARFYVGVGTPGTRVRDVPPETLRTAREILVRTASGMPGVEIAPENETPRNASRMLRERNLVGFFLDASIVELQEQSGATRARVSVVLQSYPDRNIRGMLEGRATMPNGTGPVAQRQVIEGALRRARRPLPPLMEAGAAAQGPRR